MKVFIKTSELSQHSPNVIASYPDNSDVAANAHGDGVIVVTVPQNLIQSVTDSNFQSRVKLVEGWRERAGKTIMVAEAERRALEVFPRDQQVRAINELVFSVLRHGPDPEKWPNEAKQRYIKIDQLWKYLGALDEVVAGRVQAPTNPLSDEHWPTRPTA